MLSEVSKVLDEFYSNLDDSSIIKKYFDMIDNAKTQEELEEIKEKLPLKNITESINYGALNEKQNLFKNKIVLKADIMDKNIIKKIGNSFLFSTIGSAFSSLEVIHYKDINKNLLQANANILDIFGLLQQVPETDDIKEIIQIGSNFDLWNYEFISKDKSNNNPKNSGNEKKALLSVFKIKGVLRNFSDLYSEVEELTPTLTDEEKLFEYLQAMKDNGNRIIPTNSSLLFGDGTQMRQYWKRTKNKIYKMITEEENQFIVQYKEQCEVLIKDYNNYQEKLEIKITEEGKILEYLQAMKENGNKIIPYNSSLLFSNGTQMAQYWNNQKNKMYKMITAEGNQFVAQYKEQCEVLINEYIEFQERKRNKKNIKNLKVILEKNHHLIKF